MVDVQAGNGAGLIAFLQRIGDHGEINPATARALRAAANTVLAVEADPMGVNIREVDVENLLDRFENLNRGRMRDNSLTTYRSRFRRSVAMYILWLDKAPDWRSAGRPQPARPTGAGAGAAGGSRSRSTRRGSQPEQQSADTFTMEPGTTTDSVPARRLVAYDVPIQPDFLVRITLPADLTPAEAKRIGRFVENLAFDLHDPSSAGEPLQPTADGS
jgi:hypothetical protein